ncbi:hypothetical protein G6F60_015428 [Rhizopus arrhizus]|nr:hypothetical protein G6F60_015428 [Rhizopus arrhizus]
MAVATRGLSGAGAGGRAGACSDGSGDADAGWRGAWCGAMWHAVVEHGSTLQGRWLRGLGFVDGAFEQGDSNTSA